MEDQNNIETKTATINPTNSQAQDENDKNKKRLLILLLILLLLGFIILFLNFLKRNIEKNSSDNDQSTLTEIEDNETSENIIVNPTSPIQTRIPSLSIQTATTTPTNDVSLTFTGPTQVKVNQTFTMKLLLDPRVKQVTGIELYIEYPKDLYEVVSFKPTDAMPIILKGPILEPGLIQVDLGTSPTQQKTDQIHIAEITLKAKKQGTGSLKISEGTRGAALTYRDYIKVVTDPLSITSY